MSLAERYISTVSLKEDKLFQCQNYSPLSDNNKHCKNYIEGGACSLPDQLMCVEWLKVNDHKSTTSNISTPDSTDQQKPITDLLGDPIPDPPPPKKQSQSSATINTNRPTGANTRPYTSTQTGIQPHSSTEAPTAPCGMTAEDIESFKALGVEVCIDSEMGQIWLVPKYTHQDRMEITPEHMALICYTRMSFPDSRIVSLQRTFPTNEEVDHE